MQDTTSIVKAVTKSGVIVCGACGHIIAKCQSLRIGLGNGTIYILCKHKDKGKKCNTVNRIDL